MSLSFNLVLHWNTLFCAHDLFIFLSKEKKNFLARQKNRGEQNKFKQIKKKTVTFLLLLLLLFNLNIFKSVSYIEADNECCAFAQLIRILHAILFCFALPVFARLISRAT